jgi:SsrA-binding protein
MSEKKSQSELVTNRRAWHDYEILETFEAGMVLQGTEIKSLRSHGASLQEAYVKTIKAEVWLVGASITPYRFGNIHNHPERRDRKLLLHKREMSKLHRATQEKGLTIVALAIYLKNGRAKIRIGIGRGKKLVDKRHDLKLKDDTRRMQRVMKEHRD